MNSVDELLDQIELILEKGFTLPLLNGRVVVRADEINSIIEEIRIRMPREINEARRITSDRNDIVADARKAADDIRRHAEERARAMVSKDEITRRATIQANETVSIANTKARQICNNAIDIAESRLRACEEILTEKQKEIRQSIAAIKNSRAELNSALHGAGAGKTGPKKPPQDDNPPPSDGGGEDE